MKQKTKKRLITFAIIALWLIGCYFIGQSNHSQTKDDNVQKEVAISEETDIDVPAEEVVEESRQTVFVSFDNAQQISTDQIPWGFTAGVITLEDESEAWLLTPGTALKTDKAAFRYCIHPWMKDTSDGAMLIIENGEDNETLSVNNQWQTFTPEEKTGIMRIEVPDTVNNDGDWVIIQVISD